MLFKDAHVRWYDVDDGLRHITMSSFLLGSKEGLYPESQNLKASMWFNIMGHMDARSKFGGHAW